MGTNQCSQPASKSSWDSQDFGDVNMVLKMVHFDKSSRPQWVKRQTIIRKMLTIITSWNGNIFRVTGPLCGEFTGDRWILRTKASDAKLWYFFYLPLTKWLSKQSWGWWFEMPSHSLWRHCNANLTTPYAITRSRWVKWGILRWGLVA